MPVRPYSDPSRNVTELVSSESYYLRNTIAAESKYQSELRNAETRRLDELAQLRFQYDTRIAENLRVEVKTTSELISAQLVKETTSLSSQIAVATLALTNQITMSTNVLSTRVSALEQFRWEIGGKTSVTDPATAEALRAMAAAIGNLKSTDDTARGRGDILGWIFGAVMAIAAVAAAVFKHG